MTPAYPLARTRSINMAPAHSTDHVALRAEAEHLRQEHTGLMRAAMDDRVWQLLCTDSDEQSALRALRGRWSSNTPAQVGSLPRHIMAHAHAMLRAQPPTGRAWLRAVRKMVQRHGTDFLTAELSSTDPDHIFFEGHDLSTAQVLMLYLDAASMMQRPCQILPNDSTTGARNLSSLAGIP